MNCRWAAYLPGLSSANLLHGFFVNVLLERLHQDLHWHVVEPRLKGGWRSFLSTPSTLLRSVFTEASRSGSGPSAARTRALFAGTSHVRTDPGCCDGPICDVCVPWPPAVGRSSRTCVASCQARLTNARQARG